MNAAHHAELIFNSAVKKVTVDFGAVEKHDQFVEKFGIDDARELVKKAHGRPLNAEALVLVVRTDFITLEAQNALLKILEEPPVSTRFVFVVASDFSMLPTLLSRFSLNSTSFQSEDTIAEFEVFITGSYQDRLSAIDKAIKAKDIDWQKAIKRGLINHVAKSDVQSDSLKGLEYVARQLLTRGASNKMLLEHAALLLGTRL
ncbi:hypothetical protein KC851_01375 [Candidatus Kaiserbacteria bacterium]|nr:hypothetical protein [Candidatus Kaiserbacteria bacterium]